MLICQNEFKRMLSQLFYSSVLAVAILRSMGFLLLEAISLSNICDGQF